MAPSTSAKQRKIKLVVYAVICMLGMLGYGACFLSFHCRVSLLFFFLLLFSFGFFSPRPLRHDDSLHS